MKSLKGQFLVATPRLQDPNFAQSVLLMLEHNEDGALGVIVNRPVEATVSDLAQQLFQEPFDWEKPINLGGPVAGPLMVLHTDAKLADQHVVDSVYSSVDAAKIQKVLRQRKEPTLIIANYAGWGPGQLESEFETDSWYAFPADAEHVFWQSDADLWKVIVREINRATLRDIAHLDDLPDDPANN